MAKKIKKVYNTKLLYRWSLPLWFTLLFIAVVVAPLVLSVFLQAFTFNNGSDLVITSKDIVMNLFKQPSANFAVFIEQVVAPIKAASQIKGMILEIAVVYVLPIAGMLVALFDVILVIFFLIGLFSGRFFHWGGPFKLSIVATIFGFAYFGGIIGLTYFLNYKFPSLAGMASFKLGCMYSIIYLSAMLGGTIILGIIYAAGFKKREFIPNKTYLENYIQQMNHGHNASIGYVPQPIIINNNQGENAAPQPVSQPPVIVNAAPIPEKVVETRVVTKVKKVHETEVDPTLKYISGHAYAKNVHLQSATIPEGVDKIGPSAFSNCVNLKIVTIPTSVKEIGYNAFFNCKGLEKIVYAGRKEEWRKIKRGSNWLSKAGTTIVSCLDGAIQVNPYRK